MDTILEKTEKQIFDLLQKKSSDEFVPIRDVVLSVIDKIEMAAKHVAGSEIYIEYTFTVRNEGEIAGYANEITDYKHKCLNKS